ncbi:MAG: carboxypeptidase-like regulatory domain-containing protein [Chitinophagaceae bacterium]|nr:carboxypeptidase-like regulatory domain-containing protein [Chitinophagaceae bacterium]
MRSLIIILLLCLPALLQAQITNLQGMVVDSASKRPIPFATIIINDNQSTGSRADSGGHYVVKSAIPVTSLTISFVGYKTQRFTFQKTDKLTYFPVFMVPQQSVLDDIIVVAGENPANRIIKAAVKNSYLNNYKNLNSYSYKAYEKFVLTGIPDSSALSDSSHSKLYRHMEDNHLLVLEAITERKHLAPDLTKETVIAQKVSGLQNPNFTVLTSQFQTTDFYDPFINITTTDFVNPISPNSWDRYFFNIIDTAYSGNDTIYVLTYHPAKGKHFPSLKGILEINTDGYAIQRVVAEPSDTALTTMFVKIEQLYAKADATHWFISKINTYIGFKKFILDDLKVNMKGTTYITEAMINPPITKKDFDGVSIDLLEDAASKSNTYWEAQRPDTLTHKEQVTYSMLDSVGKKNNFDKKFNMLNAFQDGNLRLQYVSVQLYNVVKFNRQEGFRLGMGLETNSDLFKKYKIGGFAGYGLRDQLWKYGGFFEWKMYYPKNIKLLLNYSMSYEESGGTKYYQGTYWGNNENYRNYTIDNFDLVTRKEIAFTSRIRKYINLELTAFDAEKNPTNNYQFVNMHSGEPVVEDQFTFSGIKAALRFSYKEKIVESLDKYYWINTGHPTIWLQVTQGFNGFIDGDYTYTKYESKFNYSFPTRSWGITTLTLEGGWVNNSIPATDLFTGRSSYSPLGLFSTNSFQTMRSGEFINSGFGAVYYRQDFQSNIIRWGKFQPNFVFVTNIGWGTLSNPETHLNISARSMDKGYFESGLMINNIFGKKFFGIARFSVGGGVFYRYGPYAFSNPLDNIAVKVSWSYNFK